MKALFNYALILARATASGVKSFGRSILPIPSHRPQFKRRTLISPSACETITLPRFNGDTRYEVQATAVLKIKSNKEYGYYNEWPSNRISPRLNSANAQYYSDVLGGGYPYYLVETTSDRCIFDSVEGKFLPKGSWICFPYEVVDPNFTKTSQ